MVWVVVDVRPQSLYPKKVHCNVFLRGWVGPRGRCGRLRKISPPQGFDPSTVRHVPTLCTDWVILELCYNVGQEHHYFIK